MTVQTGIVILAAGNSSRLGQPKQLLQYKGATLIKHVYEVATDATGSQVVVVTGRYHSEISEELEHLPVHFAYNPDWEQGMGSSIKTGLDKLLELYPEITQVIISVSDQPFVSINLFLQLIESAQASDLGIVASEYNGVKGTPVLFKKKYIPLLFSLEASEGAKKILKQFDTEIVTVSFPKGEIDIDTARDYQDLLES